MADQGIIADIESGQQKLEEIWRLLEIDRNGSLTVHQLSTVCDQIGMKSTGEEEMKDLFDQLDTDKDGRITFNDFLLELFEHGENRVKVKPVIHSPLSTKYSSILSFSSLDPDNTGFIKSDDLVDQWVSYGISASQDVLRMFGLDKQKTLSVKQLSAVLEKELLHNLDHSQTYHVALLTFLCEFEQLKSTLEQVTEERDKLIAELKESNSQRLMLAEEGDDIRKKMDTKIELLELRYKQQVKYLESCLSKERYQYSEQLDEQNGLMETMIENSMETEKMFNKKISAYQEDLKQTKNHLAEMTSQVRKVERQMSTELQQNTVPVAENWDGYQIMSGKQVLEEQNKTLKMELNLLKGELNKVQRQLMSTQERLPKQDVVSRNVFRKASFSQSFPGFQTQRNHLSAPVTGSRDDGEEAHKIQEELNQLNKNMERERKYIEHAFRMEISEIEEMHTQEKEELIKQISVEKEHVRNTCRKNNQEAIAELEQKLQKQFALEKQDLIQKYESEKNLMEQQFAQQQIKLTERLQADFREDLQIKRELQKLHEAEKLCQRSFSKRGSVSSQNLSFQEEMERKLTCQMDELKHQFEIKRKEIKKMFVTQLGGVEQLQQQAVLELQDLFVRRLDGLKSKLRQDFQELLDKYKNELIMERASMSNGFQNQWTDMEDTLELEKPNCEETCRKTIKVIEEDRQQLRYTLQVTVKALSNQSKKLHDQLKAGMKREMFLKDMYTENANLIRSIQHTEARCSQTDTHCLRLEEMCQVLQNVIHRLYPTSTA